MDADAQYLEVLLSYVPVRVEGDDAGRAGVEKSEEELIVEANRVSNFYGPTG